jgi:K(+)-stimulated pyrophosphate-energized sodium pump
MALGSGVLALAFAWWKASWINKQDPGDEKMVSIGDSIRKGAMAFLKREYSVLVVAVLLVAGLLCLIYNGYARWVSAAFVFGAFCSALSGFFGMRVATASNLRTAQAARKGLPAALRVAFSGGSVMGLCVVGLGLAGLVLTFFATVWKTGGTLEHMDLKLVLQIVTGFSMGASSIALFARVGGGIYTKAADVGADLVGKVEAGIPEDDPRNPATIADNVGDNVGDVAGMGADLFESYVGAILAAMVLGTTVRPPVGVSRMGYVLLPLVVAAAGILLSMVATLFVRTREGGNPQKALNCGTFGAGILMVGATWGLCRWLVPDNFSFDVAKQVADAMIETTARIDFDANVAIAKQLHAVAREAGALAKETAKAMPFSSLGVFGATVVGLVSGALIGIFAEHYTAEGKGPANSVSEASQTGSATNIIAGLGVGMRSTALPLIVLGIASIACFYCAGLYGIAMGGLGMLATTGIQLAVDAYGPIADNAGGIAQMSGLEEVVRQRTDKLDAVGNTTAAIGKGFAIGSAALTALALFAAFRESAKLPILDITDPKVMSGLLVGAMLPYWFSAMAMRAVGEAAKSMVEEVRRQFREIPGLLAGKEGVKADYARCVDISTSAAIRKMTGPALLGILSPLVVGFGFGKEMLGGLLAGVTASGVLLALFMSNAGGCWDNAKKHIEGGVFGGKGSDAHKAAVVGDTVGDPFKDTAGPALNILMKLMSVVALVVAPVLVTWEPLIKRWLANW